jgi:hypothetical protein
MEFCIAGVPSCGGDERRGGQETEGARGYPRGILYLSHAISVWDDRNNKLEIKQTC